MPPAYKFVKINLSLKIKRKRPIMAARQAKVDKADDREQEIHHLFRVRPEKYRKVRPRFKFTSFRTQRQKFITDKERHPRLIEKSYDKFVEDSKVAKDKTGALFILLRIKDDLIDHGKDFRAGIDKSPVLKEFDIFKKKTDIHPSSGYRSKSKYQKGYQRIIAAEIESLAFTMYLEEISLKNKWIVEVLPDDHRIFNLNPMVDDVLDLARHLHLA